MPDTGVIGVAFARPPEYIVCRTVAATAPVFLDLVSSTSRGKKYTSDTPPILRSSPHRQDEALENGCAKARDQPVTASAARQSASVR